MNVKTALVSREICESFDRDGVAVLRGFLDAEWLDHMAQCAEEIRNRVKQGDTGEEANEAVVLAQNGDYVFCENGWTFNEKLRRFAFESGVAQAAAEVMKSREARLFETLSIYKERGSDSATPWHQDWPQHGMEGQQACSVWLSLDSVTGETGALRFVPGSHKGPWYTPGTMPAGREDDVVALPAGPVPDIDGDPARFPDIRSYDTEPGDVILLHPNVLHGTRASAEGSVRRNFSIRFFGDDAKRKATKWEWHSWLKDLPVKDGEPMRSDMFPVLWPQ